MVCPGSQAPLGKAGRASLGSGFGERARGVRARAGGGGVPSSLPNNPHYLPHVLLLADSEQQVADLTATITCLFEEKIGLKWPGAFSL